jgi:hypothetical protein
LFGPFFDGGGVWFRRHDNVLNEKFLKSGTT